MKSTFFAQKLSDLGSGLNELMQLKRVINVGIVIKYIVIVDGSLGADFVTLQQKRNNFYVILIALRTFQSHKNC